jgi:hypothetical protein
VICPGSLRETDRPITPCRPPERRDRGRIKWPIRSPLPRGNPRWALPDMIATSKLESYAWQDEFRLVFSLNAFGFEKVALRLTRGDIQSVRNHPSTTVFPVSAASLCDSGRLHQF